MKKEDAKQLKRNVGDQVAAARHRRNATQAQLAEELKVSVSYLQRIERGAANLTLESLATIAAALGVEVTELLAPAPRDRRPGRPAGRKAE